MRPKVSDCFCVLGIVSVMAGLWLIYPPIAVIALGMVLVPFGVFLNRRGL